MELVVSFWKAKSWLILYPRRITDQRRRKQSCQWLQIVA